MDKNQEKIKLRLGILWASFKGSISGSKLFIICLIVFFLGLLGIFSKEQTFAAPNSLLICIMLLILAFAILKKI